MHVYTYNEQCVWGSKRKKINDTTIRERELQGERERERMRETVHRAEKLTQGGNLPVDRYLLWSSCYAGGRLDICMWNWRWHKGMNLLMHGWTHEPGQRAENGACLTQLYVERWSGIGRLSALARWHVPFIPHHVRGRSAARERASSLRKKKRRGPSLVPSSCHPAVLHVTCGQERGKLKVSVEMEYRSGARRERNSTLANPFGNLAYAVENQIRLNTTMMFICSTINSG